MSWLGIPQAAKYARMRKVNFIDALEKGYLHKQPSLSYQLGYSHELVYVVDTAEIDALIKGEGRRSVPR